jgi:YdjC-like protein/Glycosyl transferase family 2
MNGKSNLVPTTPIGSVKGQPLGNLERASGTARVSRSAIITGRLIVNADDWGEDRETTDRILECILCGTISSVSAMVFMEDSERAAAIARERRIDAGLHLNLTEPFSAHATPTRVIEHHKRISRFLSRHRFAQVIFHPKLIDSFRYVVEAQLEEFNRLYGARPQRIDGHHHMHLCANVVLGRLLPAGTIVRRNFSFGPGEKSFANRFYRRIVDRMLISRHRIVDYFTALTPLEPAGRLERIFSLAREHVVELETHPFNPEEYKLLAGSEFLRRAGNLQIASRFILPRRGVLKKEGMEHRMGTYSIDSNLTAAGAIGAGLTPSTIATRTPHIAICICTYKRAHLLQRLLEGLVDQETDGLFTYSIIVADNDQLRSAEPLVSSFSLKSAIPLKYCVEPQQNIALARNKAVENASGDFVAFIDDDEFPTKRWLLTLYAACNEYGVDGVLGPVKRHFDEKPPAWIVKSNFYERPTYPTGFVIDWKKGRTGNVLLRKRLFSASEQPFRQEFRAGEDQDFFRRMIDKGCVFIWCDEAVAYEVVPPARWKRSFMLRRALLRGAIEPMTPTFGPLNIAKSIVAVPAYAAALPFALVLGHHRFMSLLVSLFDHVGKLLALAGINPVREPYVTD